MKSSKIDQILTSVPIPIAPKKKLLWQLDYKSVPYYVRFYHNQLFVCDKYGLILNWNKFSKILLLGYLSVYKLNRSNDF